MKKHFGRSTGFFTSAILATLLLPDRGTATVLGLDTTADLWAIRARVGYMPGRFSLYPDLSVTENLDFFASVAFASTFGVGVLLSAASVAVVQGALTSHSALAGQEPFPAG